MITGGKPPSRWSGCTGAGGGVGTSLGNSTFASGAICLGLVIWRWFFSEKSTMAGEKLLLKMFVFFFFLGPLFQANPSLWSGMIWDFDSHGHRENSVKSLHVVPQCYICYGIEGTVFTNNFSAFCLAVSPRCKRSSKRRARTEVQHLGGGSTM